MPQDDSDQVQLYRRKFIGTTAGAGLLGTGIVGQGAASDGVIDSD